MDKRACRSILSVVFLALATVALSACVEGCRVPVVITGQLDRPRAIERVVQDVVALGFEERKNLPIGADEWRMFYMQGGPAAGYSVGVSIRKADPDLTVTFGVAGTPQFSSAGVDLHRRLVERLQGAFGSGSVSTQGSDSCKQSS
jgi:hypothetical protein